MNQAFYKAASDELAGGVRDEALWAKATTEMAGHSHVMQCAHYLRQRAREMEFESTRSIVARIAPTGTGRWLVISAVVLVLVLAAVDLVRLSDRHRLQRMASDVSIDARSANIAASGKDSQAYGKAIAFMDGHCRYIAANRNSDTTAAVTQANRLCSELPLVALRWYAWEAMARSGQYATDKATAASRGTPLLPEPPFQRF